jgi:hypothetical protein
MDREREPEGDNSPRVSNLIMYRVFLGGSSVSRLNEEGGEEGWREGDVK